MEIRGEGKVNPAILNFQFQLHFQIIYISKRQLYVIKREKESEEMEKSKRRGQK